MVPPPVVGPLVACAITGSPVVDDDGFAPVHPFWQPFETRQLGKRVRDIHVAFINVARSVALLDTPELVL